jgi:hypothetical protein
MIGLITRRSEVQILPPSPVVLFAGESLAQGSEATAGVVDIGAEPVTVTVVEAVVGVVTAISREGSLSFVARVVFGWRLRACCGGAGTEHSPGPVRRVRYRPAVSDVPGAVGGMPVSSWGCGRYPPRGVSTLRCSCRSRTAPGVVSSPNRPANIPRGTFAEFYVFCAFFESGLRPSRLRSMNPLPKSKSAWC